MRLAIWNKKLFAWWYPEIEKISNTMRNPIFSNARLQSFKANVSLVQENIHRKSVDYIRMKKVIGNVIETHSPGLQIGSDAGSCCEY